MSPKAVDDGLTLVAGLVPLLSGPSFDPAKAVGLFDQPILMNLVLRAESVVDFVERPRLFLPMLLFELQKNDPFRCQSLLRYKLVLTIFTPVESCHDTRRGVHHFDGRGRLGR